MGMNNVSPKSVFSGLFWVYLESVSGQLVHFIVTIVLARLLAPEHYGTIALVSVFINLANVLISPGFCSSLIQKKNADDTDYSTMFWFNLAFSIILYILIFVFSVNIASYYKSEDLVLIIRILALSIPFAAFNSIQMAYVSSHLTFKKSFLSTTSGTIISGIIGIIMAYMGAGVWALVTQRLLSVIINTILLRLVIEWFPSFIFSWKRLVPMLGYGWKLLATGLMFTGYSEVRSLIIGKRYSASDLGFYNQGYNFPRFIASNVDTSINRVLFPVLSKDQDNSNDISRKTRRAAKTSAFIMTPLLLGLAFASQSFVQLLLGQKWISCVPYMQIMCIVWWLQPVQSCSLQAIKAIGRSDIYLKAEFINKAFGLLVLAYAVLIENTVYAIALSMLFAQIEALFVYGFLSNRYLGYKIMEQISDLLIPMLVSMPSCLLVLFLEKIIDNTIICVILQLLSGGLLLYIICTLTKPEAFTYLKSTFFRIKNRG